MLELIFGVLGVVLYEMLSGKVPFTGETINHTIVSILEKERCFWKTCRLNCSESSANR